MKPKYDPHLAHPDTVLGLLEWVLSGATGSEVHTLTRALRAQCAAPSGPPGAAAKESREDIAAPGEATSLHRSSETVPGGAEARTPREPAPAPATAREESVPAREGSRVIPIRCSRCQAAVTPGEAEQHWLNCGAPQVAEHPDERPCGCEDTDVLKAQLAALRARNFDLATHLSRIRKLARAPEVVAFFEAVDREP